MLEVAIGVVVLVAVDAVRVVTVRVWDLGGVLLVQAEFVAALLLRGGVLLSIYKGGILKYWWLIVRSLGEVVRVPPVLQFNHAVI